MRPACKYGDWVTYYLPRLHNLLFKRRDKAARFSGFIADQRFRAGSLRRIETTCFGFATFGLPRKALCAATKSGTTSFIGRIFANISGVISGASTPGTPYTTFRVMLFSPFAKRAAG
jgi:hypothetical protein